MSALTLGLTSALAATAVPVAAASVATAPRAYEQVTPVDKHGADVDVGVEASDSGDDVAFMSLGAYGDTNNNVLTTVYGAHRSADGWTVATLSAPSSNPAPTLADAIAPSDLSDDLRVAYWMTPGGTSLAAGDRNAGYDVFSVTGGAATWLSPSPVLPDTAPGSAYYAGRSADGRHVVVESDKQLLPSVPGGTTRVYELVDGQPRVASVLPSGAPSPANPNASFGDGGTATAYLSTYRPGDARAISADGRRIFFTVDGQLYVRVDGRSTELISASHVAGAGSAAVNGADAKFVTASADGGRVFFTASKPLTDDAVAGGLYAYDLDDDALELIAEADGTANSRISGVVRSAADGSRVYFVSTSALGTAGATAGRPNLFVGGDGAAPRFIATLSGGDASLWNTGELATTASISADGRRLAFATTAALTSAPTGGRAQVYEYAEGSGLTCASCPPAGVTATAAASLRDLPGNQRTQPRGFAADGTLFFESADPLVAEDTDAAYDVYAYDADGVHLISAGTATDTHVVDVSADGRDVFLRTHDALVPGDTDGGYGDVYDARVGGGFPVAETPAACSGEACRGPLPADPPAPGAPASLAARDASAAPAFADAPPAFSLARVSAASRAAFARTGKLSLSVKVSDTAVLSATATAKLRGARKATTVASATAGREGAGTARLALKLSSKARASLKRSGKLTVTVVVRCSDTKKTARTTLVLRQTKKAA